MAQALYSKYRPKTFDDVIGQTPILQTLKNSIKANKVSHAYMFCGPRGTGKTTMARLLAKACMCDKCETGQPTVDFCGTCQNCDDIAKGMHPDVYELDAASRTGVENVRDEIISRVGFAATRGTKKIYIIDEVHMLSTAAFNALLKTLEEPPEHVIFILCTTDPEKVPETILSRCQRFNFSAISNDDVVTRLKYVCEQEKVEADDDALDAIAQNCNGAMRNALTQLEQLIAFSDGKITLESVNNVGAQGDDLDYKSLIENLGMRNLPAAFDWIDQACQNGADFHKIYERLGSIIRDMYLASCGSELTNSSQEIIDAHLDLFTTERLHYIMSLLPDLGNQLKTSSNVRLTFELTVAKISNPKGDLTLEALAERISNLEIVATAGDLSPAFAVDNINQTQETPKPEHMKEPLHASDNVKKQDESAQSKEESQDTIEQDSKLEDSQDSPALDSQDSLSDDSLSVEDVIDFATQLGQTDTDEKDSSNEAVEQVQETDNEPQSSNKPVNEFLANEKSVSSNENKDEDSNNAQKNPLDSALKNANNPQASEKIEFGRPKNYGEDFHTSPNQTFEAGKVSKPAHDILNAKSADLTSAELTNPNLKIPQKNEPTDFAAQREKLQKQVGQTNPAVSQNADKSPAVQSKNFDSTADIKSMWQQIYSNIRKKFPAFGATLLTADATFNKGTNQLILKFPSKDSFSAGVLKKPDSMEKIHGEVKAIMGDDVGFNIEVEESQHDDFNPTFVNNFRSQNNEPSEPAASTSSTTSQPLPSAPVAPAQPSSPALAPAASSKFSAAPAQSPGSKPTVPFGANPSVESATNVSQPSVPTASLNQSNIPEKPDFSQIDNIPKPPAPHAPSSQNLSEDYHPSQDLNTISDILNNSGAYNITEE